jgi:hypothetical protein
MFRTPSICHAVFLPDQNITLLKRIRATLTGGATVAIWDLETPDPESDPAAGDGVAFFSGSHQPRCATAVKNTPDGFANPDTTAFASYGQLWRRAMYW